MANNNAYSSAHHRREIRSSAIQTMGLDQKWLPHYNHDIIIMSTRKQAFALNEISFVVSFIFYLLMKIAVMSRYTPSSAAC